jgi:hypothetical protein
MLARRAVNPAVRTVRACRGPQLVMFLAEPQAPDIGRTLLAMLRTVAGLRDRAPRPWTGSWTEPSVQPVRSGPSAAQLRGIRAASANDARSRTSHNPPVVGSSPTRPTSSFTSSLPAPLVVTRRVSVRGAIGRRPENPGRPGPRPQDRRGYRRTRHHPGRRRDQHHPHRGPDHSPRPCR